MDLTILPEYRGRGIGTKIISEILEKTTKPVRIYLEIFNESVGLFKRLGFRPGIEEGLYRLWEYDAGINSVTND